MAIFDTTQPAFGSASAAGRLFSFHRLWSTFVAWNDARVTRKALSALTDRELDDIGLTRGDIDAVADSTLFR